MDRKGFIKRIPLLVAAGPLALEELKGRAMVGWTRAVEPKREFVGMFYREMAGSSSVAWRAEGSYIPRADHGVTIQAVEVWSDDTVADVLARACRQVYVPDDVAGFPIGKTTKESGGARIGIYQGCRGVELGKFYPAVAPGGHGEVLPDQVLTNPMSINPPSLVIYRRCPSYIAVETP